MNRLLTLNQELQRYRRTNQRLSGSASRYSTAKTPPVAAAGLFGIAGLTAVDAAGLGLGAASLLQPAMTKSGNLVITSEKAQRLLTSQARQKLGGIPKNSYTYPILLIGMQRIVGDNAHALLEVTWEGNAYGEIGTAYVRRNLNNTDAFTKSSLNVNFTKLDRIPPHTMKDPREWPMAFAYDGTYDPYGNGQFEFQGEFEINAFGGLTFKRHVVKSVSLIDFTLAGKPEDYVIKKSNRSYQVPPLPAKQKAYLVEQLNNP